MRKSLQDLLNEKLVEVFTSTPKQVQEQIQLAEHDLVSAKKMMSSDPDLAGWAHKAAYNAMLSASRGLMFHRGYRAKISAKPHKSTVQFIEAEYSDVITTIAVQTFRNARLERHNSQYEHVGTNFKPS